MSSTTVVQKRLQELLLDGETQPGKEWHLEGFCAGECMTYIAWNKQFKEVIVIDPRREELALYQSALAGIQVEAPGIIPLCVIDTHTHADHISGAAELAKTLNVPLVMHHLSPTPRATLRVTTLTALRTHSGPLQFIPTPGHTPDGICVHWGPFLFTGDTVLMGDVGRDDLPGGDPAQHYESVQALKKLVQPETLVLPGHDNKKGQTTSWQTQLRKNPSLTQGRDEFIQECAAFEGPAPVLFKKSLVENFK